MKVLIVCLLVASASAQILLSSDGGLIRTVGSPLTYSYSAAAPIAYQAAPLAYSAPVAYSAPAPIAYSAPVAVSSPVAISSPVVAPLATSSQYHAQDELGQASFGYAHPGQAATNFRDALGNQVGSYAYINPEGKEIRVSYTADSRGFRVLSNALPEAPEAPAAPALEAPVFDGKAPEPVQDTAEVIAAKAEFEKLYKEAAAAAEADAVPEAAPLPAPQADELKAPEPVQDTAEVVAARAEFEKLFKEAKDAADAAPDTRKKRQIVLSAGLPLAYAQPLLAQPLLAKQTVKTLALEADKDAKTPADTTLLDVKEKKIDVLTPIQPALAYPTVLRTIVSPIALKTVDRKKRQIILSGGYLPGIRVASPVVAKSVLKTVSLEANKDAKTPAATTLVEAKEKDVEVLTPLASPLAYSIW